MLHGTEFMQNPGRSSWLGRGVISTGREGLLLVGLLGQTAIEMLRLVLFWAWSEKLLFAVNESGYSLEVQRVSCELSPKSNIYNVTAHPKTQGTYRRGDGKIMWWPELGMGVGGVRGGGL